MITVRASLAQRSMMRGVSARLHIVGVTWGLVVIMARVLEPIDACVTDFACTAMYKLTGLLI